MNIKHKNCIKCLVIGALASALSFMFIACGDPSGATEPEDPPAWASNFALPDKDAAAARLTEIYGSDDKVYLLNSNIARMPCPENGETVTFNMTYDINAYAKLILEDCIAEFNEVFAVINPNYKFAVDYSPTEDELKQKYSVRMTHAETIKVTENSFALGMAHVSYDNGFTELGDFGITLKDEVLTNGSYLMTTFKHEFMHLLGAGDAYKNPAAAKNTVMQSYTVNGYHHFSATDVAFIDALYRNPDAPYSDEKIAEYIDNYETVTAHTRNNATVAVYNKLLDDTTGNALATGADALGYKDTAEFKAAVANGIKRDTSFGSATVGFTELEYSVRPDETYFGSFDVTDKKYRHGRDKGGLTTSMGIDYTDYSNGLLFAAPNGTAYRTLFVKQDKFVMLLLLNGGFTALDGISLSVWHVCTVNG